MEDFKSKFFQGASSVKEKFESSQELSEMKGELKKLEEERTHYMLEIGESAYSNFRKKEDLQLPFTEKIIELDKKIFELLNAIEKMKIESEEKTCECGNKLAPSDKFCKKCGKKVSGGKELDPENMKECSVCKTLNQGSNNFCNSCGNKLA